MVSSSIHRQFWDTAANKVYADSKKAPSKDKSTGSFGLHCQWAMAIGQATLVSRAWWKD